MNVAVTHIIKIVGSTMSQQERPTYRSMTPGAVFLTETANNDTFIDI